MESVEYPYRPKSETMLTACFGSIACMLIFAHKGSTNDRGLILEGFIHFDREGATAFYWWMAALSMAMAVIGFMGTLIAFFSNQYLELSKTELSAPKSILSLSNTIVPLSSIVKLELRTVRKQRFLRVYYDKGRLTIAAANLPDADAFNHLYARLSEVFAPRD